MKIRLLDQKLKIVHEEATMPDSWSVLPYGVWFEGYFYMRHSVGDGAAIYQEGVVENL